MVITCVFEILISSSAEAFWQCSFRRYYCPSVGDHVTILVGVASKDHNYYLSSFKLKLLFIVYTKLTIH